MYCARGPDAILAGVSKANLELVRGIYGALAEWRVPESIHPDAEYVNPPYAVEPGTRPWSVAIERLREIYPEFRMEPEEYVPVGDDQVMVVARANARGISGVDASARLGHLWTIRDGKAVRFEWFKDPAEAFEAIGLGPATEPTRPQTGSNSP